MNKVTFFPRAYSSIIYIYILVYPPQKVTNSACVYHVIDCFLFFLERVVDDGCGKILTAQCGDNPKQNLTKKFIPTRI